MPITYCLSATGAALLPPPLPPPPPPRFSASFESSLTPCRCRIPTMPTNPCSLRSFYSASLPRQVLLHWSASEYVRACSHLLRTMRAGQLPLARSLLCSGIGRYLEAGFVRCWSFRRDLVRIRQSREDYKSSRRRTLKIGSII